MVKIIRQAMNPGDLARIENAVATQEKNTATIAYVAMMADVEIEEEEETVNG